MPQAPAYILWLPSWYPNKLDPFDGDFIQRHAVAVSAFVPVHVKVDVPVFSFQSDHV